MSNKKKKESPPSGQIFPAEERLKLQGFVVGLGTTAVCSVMSDRSLVLGYSVSEFIRKKLRVSSATPMERLFLCPVPWAAGVRGNFVPLLSLP